MPENGGAKFFVTLAVSMCPMSLLSVLCSVSQLCLLCPIYLGKCREHLICFPVKMHEPTHTTCTLHSLNIESLLSSKTNSTSAMSMSAGFAWLPGYVRWIENLAGNQYKLHSLAYIYIYIYQFGPNL